MPVWKEMDWLSVKGTSKERKLNKARSQSSWRHQRRLRWKGSASSARRSKKWSRRQWVISRKLMAPLRRDRGRNRFRLSRRWRRPSSSSLGVRLARQRRTLTRYFRRASRWNALRRRLVSRLCHSHLISPSATLRVSGKELVKWLVLNRNLYPLRSKSSRYLLN